ncbi:hypothetical protein [Brevibacillus sp. MER 51]|uniref:hypothetical protein n=1 Tax=Brevibacillus sp. MER 51 TaxID=2939560 RepID=UPI00203F30AF|nr:hypothetical protein [Brevibacillus sp. MER 51]MCM3145355.1 hypothetical protein [Brevibacillus sp. MER 51]
MSKTTALSLSERYAEICRRAADGDPSARAIKIITEAVIEDKIHIDQLRMISEANKKDGPLAAYELFLTFYKHSQQEEAAAI